MQKTSECCFDDVVVCLLYVVYVAYGIGVVCVAGLVVLLCVVCVGLCWFVLGCCVLLCVVVCCFVLMCCYVLCCPLHPRIAHANPEIRFSMGPLALRVLSWHEPPQPCDAFELTLLSLQARLRRLHTWT